MSREITYEETQARIDLALDSMRRGLHPYNGASVLVPVHTLPRVPRGHCPVCLNPCDHAACTFVRHEPVDWKSGFLVVFVVCKNILTVPTVIDVRTAGGKNV